MNDQDHWKLFTQFCQAELATGGPDPQIPTIAHLSKNSNPVERVWLAGCYGAHHCVPSAYLVWTAFRPHEVLENPTRLEAWLEQNWDVLPVRPEMKSHRMLEKRTKCLWDFAKFAIGETWTNPAWTYENIWANSQYNVKYFGRYMAIKFIEILRQTVRPDLELTDLRAKSAWSPRRTLSWLFPQSELLGDEEDKSDQAIFITEKFAIEARLRLASIGVVVNMFQLQVLLCEYREALVGGYYPGGSLDEELMYMSQAQNHLSLDVDHFAPVIKTRMALFPHEYLGEVGGWNGIRKEKFLPFKGKNQ